MRTARLWLLILLTALLPLRGLAAVHGACGPQAAAVLAAPVAGAAVAPLATTDDGHGHEHDHVPASHAPAQADLHADHAPAAPDDAPTCTLCCAFCAATPLPRASTAVPTPLAAGPVGFPAPDVPTVTFLSAGPERPPRSA